MNVARAAAIAFAVPLVLGMTGETSSAQSGAGNGSAASEDSSPGSEAQGGSETLDPMVEPGPSIMGHASDRIVDGKIASVSPDRISIESEQGETKTLKLVPQTQIQVNGSDATRSDLQEGQPVRASFNDVDGEDVAVQVRASGAAASARSARPSSSSEQPWWQQTGPGGQWVEVPPASR